METERYWEDAQRIAAEVAQQEKLKMKCFNTVVLDKVGLKRAIQDGIPPEFESTFDNLWKEVEEFANEPL